MYVTPCRARDLWQNKSQNDLLFPDAFMIPFMHTARLPSPHFSIGQGVIFMHTSASKSEVQPSNTYSTYGTQPVSQPFPLRFIMTTYNFLSSPQFSSLSAGCGCMEQTSCSCAYIRCRHCHLLPLPPSGPSASVPHSGHPAGAHVLDRNLRVSLRPLQVHVGPRSPTPRSLLRLQLKKATIVIDREFCRIIKCQNCTVRAFPLHSSVCLKYCWGCE